MPFGNKICGQFNSRSPFTDIYEKVETKEGWGGLHLTPVLSTSEHHRMFSSHPKAGGGGGGGGVNRKCPRHPLPLRRSSVSSPPLRSFVSPSPVLSVSPFSSSSSPSLFSTRERLKEEKENRHKAPRGGRRAASGGRRGRVSIIQTRNSDQYL